MNIIKVSNLNEKNNKESKKSFLILFVRVLKFNFFKINKKF